MKKDTRNGSVNNTATLNSNALSFIKSEKTKSIKKTSKLNINNPNTGKPKINPKVIRSTP